MLNIGLQVSKIVNLKPGYLHITECKFRVVNGKGGVDRDLALVVVSHNYSQVSEIKFLGILSERNISPS